MGDDHSTGHRGDERLDRFVERRRIYEVDGSKSVHQNRRFGQRLGRATDAIDGATGDEAAGVDWNCGKGDGLVFARVEAA